MKNILKGNLKNKIYILAFMLILIVPFVFMNHKENQKSEIDNKVLTEFPELTVSSETIEQLEDYVDDRIGFREQAIALYTDACDKLFGIMIHPLFMYGKEGHIYYKDKDYVAAYQRLNTDEEYLDSFTGFLSETKEYLDSKDIKFLYYLCPDKKTIYPEYFPDNINVKEDNGTIIAGMRDRLEKTDIDYIIPDNELFEAKKEKVVYNKKYDATHWNEFGSIMCQQMIDKYFLNWFPDVKPLTEDDFTLEFVTMEHLDNSEFPINDDVPVYSLITDTSQDATEYLMPCLEDRINTTTFYAHFLNPEVQNDRILLIFTDSYFATYHKYYNNRFKEVYYVHRQNAEYLQYFVDLVFPSAVIFETAERCITSDMPLLTDFSDYYYEPSYDGSFDKGDAGSDALDLSYTVTNAKGVNVDGNKIYINPNMGDSIVSIDGILNNYEKCKDLNLYMIIDGNYIETDYAELHKTALEDGLKKFTMNVQRRYVAPGEIKLIAVDRNTRKEYPVETFEVLYGN